MLVTSGYVSFWDGGKFVNFVIYFHLCLIAF